MNLGVRNTLVAPMQIFVVIPPCLAKQIHAFFHALINSLIILWLLYLSHWCWLFVPVLFYILHFTKKQKIILYERFIKSLGCRKRWCLRSAQFNVWCVFLENCINNLYRPCFWLCQIDWLSHSIDKICCTNSSITRKPVCDSLVSFLLNSLVLDSFSYYSVFSICPRYPKLFWSRSPSSDIALIVSFRYPGFYFLIFKNIYTNKRDIYKRSNSSDYSPQGKVEWQCKWRETNEMQLFLIRLNKTSCNSFSIYFVYV